MKNVGFWVNSVEDDNGAAAATLGGQAGPDRNKDFKDFVLPLNVAIEAEATSWLTLRAGATMDLVNSRRFASSNKGANANPAAITDKGQSQNGNTNFRIGSTFKFGKLHLDSAFGTGAANAAVNQNGSTNSGLDNQSVGLDSQTFALLSASYHW
ncbi:MAG: hypothetical protein HY075_00995 [Deltaproteobacteria bacterium]|nr:hypothetical protein [Deltaproteobacteria bacterium]